MSAFFHKNIFLRTGFGLNDLHAISSRTISWSLFAMDGSGLHRRLNSGWEVSIMSKVLSLHVGKSTICSNPLSATISRKAWLVLMGYCLLVAVCSDQLISRRLKSSPIKYKSFFFSLWWYLFLPSCCSSKCRLFYLVEDKMHL